MRHYYNDFPCGWVFVWKCPIVEGLSLQGAGSVQQCLVKVGVAEPDKLLRRFYDVGLGWRKLAGLSNGEVGIPMVAKKGVGETEQQVDRWLREFDAAAFPNVLCIMWVDHDDCFSPRDAAQCLRSLLGVGFPPKWLAAIVDGWHRGLPKKKKPAKPTMGSLGHQDYVLTNAGLLSHFGDAARRAMSFPDLDLPTVTDDLATLFAGAPAQRISPIQITFKDNDLGALVGVITVNDEVKRKRVKKMVRKLVKSKNKPAPPAEL